MFPALYKTCPLSDNADEACREPENLESLLAMHELKETLSIILPLPVQRDIEYLKNGHRLDEDTNCKVDRLIYGNKSCPESLSHINSDSLEERSTCPYYYVISHDPTRYPGSIAEARCKCTYCMDDSTGENVCEPIYFPKIVLRKQDCVNGTYEYKPEAYYLQNGCTCAKRHFTTSSPDNTTPIIPFV